MVSKRILANLVVFFAASVLLVGYGAVTLFGNPFVDRRTVVTELPDAGGLRTGFSASHDGVVIGTVSDLQLRGGAVRVTVELDPGVTIPAGVEARVVRASAVGEQRLDLTSTGEPTGGALPDGALVPVAEDPIPPDVVDVLATTEELFAALPTDDLNTVIHELAVGLDGRSSDLRSTTRSLTVISEDVVAVEPELRALLDDAPQVLDDFTELSPNVHRALENTEALTGILAARDDDLVRLLGDGADLATLAGDLLLDARAPLTCLVGDVQTINATLQGETLADLDQALEINRTFFGTVEKVAPRGESADVGYGPPLDDALWLRTRLLVPPEQPNASRYVPPRAPRPVLDGAPCEDVYGDGSVDPAPPPSGSQVDLVAAEPPSDRAAEPPGSADLPADEEAAGPARPGTIPDPSGRNPLPVLVLGALVLALLARIPSRLLRRRNP